MSKKSFYLLFLLVFSSVSLSACTLPWKNRNKIEPIDENSAHLVAEKEEKSDRLKKFSSIADLNVFTSSHQISALPEWKDSLPIENISAFKDNAVDSVSAADTVKHLDNTIYYLLKDELLVLERESEDKIKLLGKIKFSFRPEALFLEDGALVVYGNDDNIPSSASYSSRQIVKIFDLSNPSNPSEIRDLAFEGDFASAFVRGGYLYFLTEKNKVDQKSSALPQFFQDGQIISSDCSSGKTCLNPEIFYFDSNYSSYRFLNINYVSLKDQKELVGAKYYVLSDEHRYALAGENIYIFHLKSLAGEAAWQAKKEVVLPVLDEENKKVVSEIESAPDYLLSESEKRNKTSLVIDKFLSKLSSEEALALSIKIDDAMKASFSKKSSASKTIVHKIAVSGSSLDYFAFTEVGGLIFNADSISDDGDYLYLGTKTETHDSLSEKKYLSNIIILDKLLEPVGKLENISTKEDIYGIRFIGKRAFLTAKDSGSAIFVISLDDKSAPAYSGTIKVPGESNYLRPIDADGNKFLSLSYEKEDSSSSDYSAIKLSLFDFSDLKQPKESDSFKIGDQDSDSIVFSDFNALYYSKEKSILSVPISFKSEGRLNFSGALIFSLKSDSMELKGKLDHSSGGFYNQLDRFQGVSYLENTVKRSFSLGSSIYTFSNKFLRQAFFDKVDSADSILELSENSDDLLVSSLRDSNSQTESAGNAGAPVSGENVNDNAVSPEGSEFSDPAQQGGLDGVFELIPPSEAPANPEI